MEEMIGPIVIGVVIGLAMGYVIAKSAEKRKASGTIKRAHKNAASILKEAKMDADGIKKEKILQAKDRFIELKSEHEKVILSRDKKMNETEKRVRDKESQISQELSNTKKLSQELEKKTADYDHKFEFIERKENELEKIHKKQVENLEVISGLSAEDAKKELVTSLKEEAKSDAMAFIQETLEEAKLTADQDARKVILSTIQRVGVEQTG